MKNDYDIKYIIIIILLFLSIKKKIYYFYKCLNLLFHLQITAKNILKKAINDKTNLCIQYDISANLINKLNTSFKKIGKNKIIKNKTFFLINHRSWADFWVDYYLLNGNKDVSYISRNIIKYILPYTSKLAIYNKTTVFFDRGNKKSRYELYDKIRDKLKENFSFIIYPEGTRNTSSISKKLRYGLLKLGFNEKVKFQIIMIKNKELIFNEKKLLVGHNIICPYYVSEVIDSTKFKNLDEFYNFVQDKWLEAWKLVYG